MFTDRDLVAQMPDMHRFARRLAGSEADADDLVQATLVRALERRGQFATGTNLRRWLAKMMFNLFASGWRRRVRFESSYDPQPVIDRQVAQPVQELRRACAEVGEALEALEPGHRAVLMLVCVHGMAYGAAARRLGVPVGTVRSRLSRARTRLSAQMQMGRRAAA
jgi:RNA polymerase sigma-70 factor, ECF subfamily